MTEKLNTKQMLHYVFFKCWRGDSVGIKRKDSVALCTRADRKHTGQRKVLGLYRDRDVEVHLIEQKRNTLKRIGSCAFEKSNYKAIWRCIGPY